MSRIKDLLIELEEALEDKEDSYQLVINAMQKYQEGSTAIIRTENEYVTYDDITKLIDLTEKVEKELDDIEVDEKEDKVVRLKRDCKESISKAKNWLYSIFKKVKNGLKVTFKVLKEFLEQFKHGLEEIWKANLTQSAWKSLMYSNPLTTILYDNKDMIGG